MNLFSRVEKQSEFRRVTIQNHFLMTIICTLVQDNFFPIKALDTSTLKEWNKVLGFEQRHNTLEDHHIEF